MLPHQPDQVPPSASLSDIHAIETPEQIPLHFAVAGIGSRFLALAIDTLIQFGVVIVVLVFSGVALRIAASTNFSSALFSQWGAAALIFASFLLFYGYFACFETLWNGQTPGKRIIGIRVVKTSGRPLTPAETIGRNLMRIVDSLPALYAIGVITALANSENKRLGDFVAGSIVVREGSLKEMMPNWQTGAARIETPQTSLGAQGLSMAELTLIDTFLHRRHNLAPDVRARMADEILDRVRSKLSLPPGGASAESILEAAAFQRRSTGAFS
jgi:uncharacterized RDD family membrane protein YckC